MKNIKRLKITMYYFLRVNIVKRNAYHRKNSNNILFWQKCLRILFDNFVKVLNALFHNNARKIILIFDDISSFHNQWMTKTQQSFYFAFSIWYYLIIIVFVPNQILESFRNIGFSIFFRLNFQNSSLPTVIYFFGWF